MKKYSILLLVLIQACASTQTITWTTGVTQASVSLPSNTQKISLLNRVVIQYPHSNVSSTLLNPNVYEIQSGLLNGFRTRIKQQGVLTLFTESKEFTQRADGNFPSPLTLAEISRVALGSDVLASLEMMDQKITDNYTIEIRREPTTKNAYVERDFYIGKRTVALKVGWRLYHTKTGEILDEWVQEQNYFYEAEALERLRATTVLNENYRKELTNLGLRQGQLYAQRISPTAQQQSRPIYTKGNEYLVQGASLAKNAQWQDAEDTWIQGIKKEKNRKKLAKLFHNLAMNEDRKGNKGKARDYASKAAKIHPLGVKTQSIIQ